MWGEHIDDTTRRDAIDGVGEHEVEERSVGLPLLDELSNREVPTTLDLGRSPWVGGDPFEIAGHAIARHASHMGEHILDRPQRRRSISQ